MKLVKNQNIQVALLLIISGAIGFFISAVYHPAWHGCIEHAQIASGKVIYPSITTLQYMMMAGAKTILNDISSMALSSGVTEVTLSVIISGVTGAVTFQALALFFFVFTDKVIDSALYAFFIYYMNYVGYGATYPIYLMHTGHSFGRIGIALVVLVISLFSLGYRKTASFLTGLFFSIHAAWAAFTVLIILVTCCFKKGIKNIVMDYKGAFIWLGIGVFTGVSLLFNGERWVMPGEPQFPLNGSMGYVVRYIEDWDWHRMKFPFISPQFLLASLAMIVSAAVLVARRASRDRFIHSFIVAAFFISAALSLITYTPADFFTILHILMPGRFINIVILLQVPILMGLIGSGRFGLPGGIILGLFLFSSLGFKCLPLQEKFQFMIYSINAEMIIKLITTVALSVSTIFLITFNPNKNRNVAKTGFFVSSIRVLCLSLIALVALGFLISGAGIKNGLEDELDAVFKAAGRERGLVLLPPGQDFYLIPLKIGRPVLLDPVSINNITYSPRSGRMLELVLKEIYGIDYMTGAPNEFSLERCRPIWEKRPRAEWMDIGRKFLIKDILVYSDWKLDLPLVTKSKLYALYRIPDAVLDKTGK